MKIAIMSCVMMYVCLCSKANAEKYELHVSTVNNSESKEVIYAKVCIDKIILSDGVSVLCKTFDYNTENIKDALAIKSADYEFIEDRQGRLVRVNTPDVNDEIAAFVLQQVIYHMYIADVQKSGRSTWSVEPRFEEKIQGKWAPLYQRGVAQIDQRVMTYTLLDCDENGIKAIGASGIKDNKSVVHYIASDKDGRGITKSVMIWDIYYSECPGRHVRNVSIMKKL